MNQATTRTIEVLPPAKLELWEEALGEFVDPEGWCMMMGLSF